MNIIRRLTLKFGMTFKNVLAEHCTYQIFEEKKLLHLSLTRYNAFLAK